MSTSRPGFPDKRWRSAYNEDWAPRVVQQLLADRAEQQAGEPSVAAGTDDEQLRGLGHAAENVGGGAARDQGLDGDVRVLLPPGRDRVGERLAGFGLEVDGVAELRADAVAAPRGVDLAGLHGDNRGP